MKITNYVHKKPTEESFINWINGYPETYHPADRDRFYTFVKTVCRYNSSNWKNGDFLKKKILEIKSNFNKNKLENILEEYESLISFYDTKYLPTDEDRSSEDDVNDSLHYYEVDVIKGKIVMTIKNKF
ncbi:MAG: hypothetical protein RI996_76 [Candidatus Parcubacteria bacterium]|jgi:hypothetical protein